MHHDNRRMMMMLYTMQAIGVGVGGLADRGRIRAQQPAGGPAVHGAGVVCDA
jgi:hypothetical protein